MPIKEQAAAALAHARACGVPVPQPATAHLRRIRAALARDVATLLGVPPTHVLVTDDPARGYGGVPGQRITVHDPDETATVLNFVPETGNIGTGGGAYLLLQPCPGCAEPQAPHDVPLVSIAGLADLGLYEILTGTGRPHPSETDWLDVLDVPVEFYGDPGHASDCPLG